MPPSLLVLLTVILYWPATRCDFVAYDDNLYVTNNPHVSGGLTLKNIGWAFVNPVAGNWHPLTVLSHMLDCQLFGLNPAGHHLTSILIHALNGMLVFLLLRQMTGAVWRSLAVAALFAVHPLRVESVVWVAERKDVLSGCFGLLALICYARYARYAVQSGEGNANGRVSYWLAFLFLVAGLMSKPMLVTWPFILLLMDYWPLGRWRPGDLGRLVREKIPFFLLAAVAGVVTFVLQKQSSAVDAVESLPFGARVGNALVAYVRYLAKTVWPGDLAVFYPHPGYWPLGEVLLAGFAIVTISVLVFFLRRSQHFMVMAWLWFIGMLVPVIGLVQVGRQAMADRYTYLPSLGLLILVVWGTYELTRRWRYQTVVLSVAAAAAVVACFVVTRQQLSYWRGTETLFQHALAVTKDNGFAHYALANFEDQAGDTGEAAHQYQDAIQLEPNQAEIHNNYGLDLEKAGRLDEAINQFEEAIRLNATVALPHHNLGALLAREGRVDNATHEFQEAIRFDPGDLEARNSLGLAFQKQGRIAEAVEQYQETIRLDPDNAEALNNLGYLWANRGENLAQARALIERALTLNPTSPAYLDSMGCLLLKQNRPSEALAYLLKAVENSRQPIAALYDHLGDAYSALNQPDQAAEAWRKSLAVEPDPAIEKKLGKLTDHRN